MYFLSIRICICISVTLVLVFPPEFDYMYSSVWFVQPKTRKNKTTKDKNKIAMERKRQPFLYFIFIFFTLYAIIYSMRLYALLVYIAERMSGSRKLLYFLQFSSFCLIKLLKTKKKKVGNRENRIFFVILKNN